MANSPIFRLESFGRRDWREWIRRPFTQGLSPHQLALAFAVGAACAFFPILGAATPLCLFAALALRLNQPVVQAINALTFPLYPALVLAFIRVGAWITRSPAGGLGPAELARLLRAHPAAFARHFGETLGHALIGWGVISVLGLPPAYLAVRAVLWAVARRRPAAAQAFGMVSRQGAKIAKA